ncbi:TonB-dependent receptor [Niabella sp. CJ426]|uniref:TonB-dependent receptor n=1 Tax=Niabella sp. CJ426 TaxID=3393740 RepID=UPI003D02736E
MRNKQVFSIFLITLFISLTTVAQQSAFKGRVTDSAGQALKGATITLEPDRHITQTNEQGAFVFPQLYAGSYSIAVSLQGYQLYEGTVEVGEVETPLMKIQLAKAAKELDAVQVTAQALNSSADNLLDAQRGAMPVTVITRQMIDKMGSRRLDEVLKEQTGIAVVNEISGGARATGIQLQGFGSDYVMILIDGQPMTGRNSGNFDLSRISVTNIERIEIIKGASSCLFGSEALGGAINIVTRHGAVQPQAMASLIYGSLNIVDASLEGETPFHHKRGSLNLAANYYRTDGYNTDPNYIARGTTAPPYNDFSVQTRARYQLTPRSTVGMSGRLALRQSFMEKVFGAASGPATGDRQDLTDVNLSAYLNHDYTSGLKSMTRYYFTRYQSEMSVTGLSAASANEGFERFIQSIHRLEQQWAYQLGSAKLTGGLGGASEQMNSTAFNSPGAMYNYFVYLQADWRLTDRTAVVGGVRYDGNNNYGGAINPSLGLQHRLSSKLELKLATGTGFKAPDFKNRYQVFVNPASNYMVIGTEVLKETLDQLQQNNEISEVRQWLLQQVAGKLDAEKSISLNASLTWKPTNQLKWEIGGFYHSLRNQINSIQIATGTGNRLIFTYQNLPSSFNTGLETSFSFNPIYGLEINGGYQWLVAKDRTVKDSIAAGNYPWYKVRNNLTGETFDSQPSDYWGIENRSRHMANLRLFYKWDVPDISFSFRMNYRGKYPFADANNNNFIDRYDQFVEGFFLLNAHIEKRLFKDHLRIKATVDNILDYRNRLIPGQPGRIILLGLSYRLFRD